MTAHVGRAAAIRRPIREEDAPAKQAVRRGDRAGAAMGLAAFALGAAGGALERGWPKNTDVASVRDFVVAHRAACLGQSAAFVLSAVAFLGFAVALRDRLARAERQRCAAATISNVVLATAAVWATLSMIAQAMQIGAVMAGADVDRSLLAAMGATFAVANVPLAAMLAGAAVLAFEASALPRWLGALSIVAAAAELALAAGAFVRSGPLAPEGWLGFVLYPLFALWLLPAAVVLGRAPERHGQM